MNKILQSDQECIMPLVEDIAELKQTQKDIIMILMFVLLFIIPAAYILAMISLRPMRRSIETIDNFVNGIVHDINTPLSVIKINSQSLKNSLKEIKQIEKNSRILQGINEVESLQEQLLFSLKSDRYTPKFELINITELLRSRVGYYSDIRDSVEVKFSHLNINPVIKVDRDLFIRMVDNIVQNAIKFSPHNSEVNIILENGLLIIEDFGDGIKKPKEVFAKYYQEQKSKKGLGLGLFIVKSIADMHNISIMIDSDGKSGTTFTIDFSNVLQMDVQ